MPNQPQASVQNNFSGGLKTEFTGLNFPENACTAASNCIFSIIGSVDRRGGINYEATYQLNTQSTVESAINTYKWNNVGGDGETQIIVTQAGGTLYFYLASGATITDPLSTQLLTSTANIGSFVASGGSFDSTIECQFADGNGYLFVFHPDCDPFYCTYNSGTQTITSTVISVQIRDFVGIPDGLQVGALIGQRPATLSAEHAYNLANQGWNNNWISVGATNGSANIVKNTSVVFSNVTAGLPITIGEQVGVIQTDEDVPGALVTNYAWGAVTAYSGTSLTINFGTFGTTLSGSTSWDIKPFPPYISIWNQQIGNYPSNGDVWWNYRDTNVTNANPDGTFDPKATINYVTANQSQAPQGSCILNAWIQNRAAFSGTAITEISTTARPSNGCWFAGRVFYTGVNANFQPTGDAPYTTWTENIYFSQIVTTPTDFGQCLQQNDPTSSTLFDLLPSDGGVIVIQGSGAIYKLFPVQNGLLVFAANGIWFITGSQGIGFAATDYTVTKISGIQAIGYSSYVGVLGWPIFWNEEGIYQVQPSQQGGGLTVNNLCLGTILTYYQGIPLQSKKYARGDYNPITYVLQWLYRSTNETDVTSRYQFDSMLNLNTYKAPFYTYAISNSSGYPWVAGINYVAGPGGSTSPDPIFKYFTTLNNTQVTFSEENDFTTWTDWALTGTGINYVSSFTTGYLLHGQAWRLWQPGYVYMYSDNSENTAYSIQGLWDYGTSGNSGKWSSAQTFYNVVTNFGNVFRKIRIRGHGLAFQFQITSVAGYPFNFAGWSIWENVNASI